MVYNCTWFTTHWKQYKFHKCENFGNLTVHLIVRINQSTGKFLMQYLFSYRLPYGKCLFIIIPTASSDCYSFQGTWFDVCDLLFWLLCVFGLVCLSGISPLNHIIDKRNAMNTKYVYNWIWIGQYAFSECEKYTFRDCLFRRYNYCV